MNSPFQTLSNIAHMSGTDTLSRGCVISVITPHKYEPCDRSVWLGGAPVNRPGSGQNKYVQTVTWCADLLLCNNLAYILYKAYIA